MVLREIVNLAIDSFRVNKVRFMLTALGMVIGSASLILVVTIAQTGKQYILNAIEGIGINTVEIEYAGGGTASAGQENVHSDFLTRDDEKAALEQVPSVAASSPVVEIHTNIGMGNGVTKDILVLGVAPEYKYVRNLVVVSGRFFDDEDDMTHAKVAVVTIPFAREKYGGTDAAINKTFEISGIPFTIIGVFRERTDTFGQSEIVDETLLIPYAVARYFQGTDDVKQIYFSIRDRDEVEQAAKDIVKVIRLRHQPTSVYRPQTLTELLVTARRIANALTVILLLVSAVTLAVGGVGIMNIMLASVRSRIREIGIRKALGATRREIKLQFLIEAVFISLAGGLIGTFLGLAIPYSIRFFTAYKIPISGLSAIVALFSAMLVGVVFGTLPATRAAQMDPVDSLKYE
jgi:putative ABC transport system permease protein